MGYTFSPSTQQCISFPTRDKCPDWLARTCKVNHNDVIVSVDCKPNAHLVKKKKECHCLPGFFINPLAYSQPENLNASEFCIECDGGQNDLCSENIPEGPNKPPPSPYELISHFWSSDPQRAIFAVCSVDDGQAGTDKGFYTVEETHINYYTINSKNNFQIEHVGYIPIAQNDTFKKSGCIVSNAGNGLSISSKGFFHVTGLSLLNGDPIIPLRRTLSAQPSYVQIEQNEDFKQAGPVLYGRAKQFEDTEIFVLPILFSRDPDNPERLVYEIDSLGQFVKSIDVATDVAALGVKSDQMYFIVGYQDQTLNRDVFDVTTGLKITDHSKSFYELVDVDIIVAPNLNKYVVAAGNVVSTFEFEDEATSFMSEPQEHLTKISMLKRISDLSYMIIAGDSNLLVVRPFWNFVNYKPTEFIDLGYQGVSAIDTFKSLRMMVVAGFTDDVLSLISLPEIECSDPLALDCELNGNQSNSCGENSELVRSDSEDGQTLSCKCISGYYLNIENETCDPCHESCISCTGPTADDCDSCGNQAEKIDGSCVCSRGFYYNSFTGLPTIPDSIKPSTSYMGCLDCPGKCFKCSRYTYTSCESCHPGYVYSTGLKTCLDCSDPEFADNTQVQVNCPAPLIMTFDGTEMASDSPTLVFNFNMPLDSRVSLDNVKSSIQIIKDNQNITFDTILKYKSLSLNSDRTKLTFQISTVISTNQSASSKLLNSSVQSTTSTSGIDLSITKALYVRYRTPYLYISTPYSADSEVIYLKRNQVNIPLVKGESEGKTEIEVLEETIKTDTEIKATVKTTGKATGITLYCLTVIQTSSTLASSSLSGIFFFVRYFQIMDIFINFIGKINVRAGKRIDQLLVGLQQLTFPTLPFMSKFSFISDGGADEAEERGKIADSTDKRLDPTIAELDQKLIEANGVGEVPSTIKMGRNLSADSVESEFYYYEDAKATNTYDDDFYSFLKYRRGSRGRLAQANVDLFMIHGQNGIIACILIFAQFLVYFVKTKKSENKCVHIMIKISRLILSIFFIRFWFLSFVELAIHDISKPQPWTFILSYLLSITVMFLYTVEITRAYIIVNKGLSQKEIKKLDYEDQWLHDDWTIDLNPTEKFNGNLYMVRDRIRWMIFLLIIATLQLLNVVQITIIFVLEIIYFMIVVEEWRAKRIFMSYWMKGKYVLQEIAILIFVSILTLFAFLQNTAFEEKGIYVYLEMTVFISILLAVLAEIVYLIAFTVSLIINFFKERAEKKKLAAEMKSMADKLAMEEGMGNSVGGSKKGQILKKVTNPALQQSLISLQNRRKRSPARNNYAGSIGSLRYLFGGTPSNMGDFEDDVKFRGETDLEQRSSSRNELTPLNSGRGRKTNAENTPGDRENFGMKHNSKNLASNEEVSPYAEFYRKRRQELGLNSIQLFKAEPGSNQISPRKDPVSKDLIIIEEQNQEKDSESTTKKPEIKLIMDNNSEDSSLEENHLVDHKKKNKNIYRQGTKSIANFDDEEYERGKTSLYRGADGQKHRLTSLNELASPEKQKKNKFAGLKDIDVDKSYKKKNSNMSILKSQNSTRTFKSQKSVRFAEEDEDFLKKKKTYGRTGTRFSKSSKVAHKGLSRQASRKSFSRKGSRIKRQRSYKTIDGTVNDLPDAKEHITLEYRNAEKPQVPGEMEEESMDYYSSDYSQSINVGSIEVNFRED